MVRLSMEFPTGGALMTDLSPGPSIIWTSLLLVHFFPPLSFPHHGKSNAACYSFYTDTVHFCSTWSSDILHTRPYHPLCCLRHSRDIILFFISHSYSFWLSLTLADLPQKLSSFPKIYILSPPPSFSPYKDIPQLRWFLSVGQHDLDLSCINL